MKLARMLLLVPCLVLPFGCDNDDDDGYAEQTGLPCETPAECYPEVAAEALVGTVECLAERVPGGYCTHTCETDADCCAVPGECRTGIKQVCSPIESAPQKYCFLSCEAADIDTAEREGFSAPDENGYCTRYAGSAFSCRSSGGGSDNRKVCLF